MSFCFAVNAALTSLLLSAYIVLWFEFLFFFRFNSELLILNCCVIMAANRDRRATAGNRMTRVLEDEAEDDDFYKNTYGGFDEVGK